jgi:predicted permease
MSEDRRTALRAALDIFDSLVAYDSARLVSTRGAEPSHELRLGTLTAGFMEFLGIVPQLGRDFTPEDEERGETIILSDEFWGRAFARDRSVLGRTMELAGRSYTVIGVAPPSFRYIVSTVPSTDGWLATTERRAPYTVARLRAGLTLARAQQSLDILASRLPLGDWEIQLGAAGGTGPSLELQQVEARRGNGLSRGLLYSFFGAAMCILLIACANVANLVLARGAARRREIALRLALGASRARVVGQLLAESLLLAFAGAAIGTMLAWWGRGLLVALRPFGNAAVVLDLPLDTRVLGFTIACAVTTAVLFGLAPALRATRVDLNAEFQGGTRSLGSGGRSRLSQVLMVVQIALSLVLLVSTGLFVRTLGHLQNVDAGFNRRNLVLFTIDATSAGYARDQFASLHARLQARLEKIPGVRAATFSRVAVLSRVRQSNTISVQGLPSPPDAAAGVNMNGLASNFFAAMELPLAIGRGFTEADDATAPGVAVVNQALVKKYFGRENPIGRRLVYTLGPTNSYSAEIVGVAGDAKYTDLRSVVPPTLYLPALQQLGGSASFALRLGPPKPSEGGIGSPDPATIFPAIRAAVREIDPTLPALDLRTQDEQLDRLHGQELLFARLSGFFGLLALALACVGLYGLMSYAVLRRTAEIGLRLALGARPSQVVGMMLRESVALVCVGIAAGVAAAYGLSRLVTAMLFGLSPTDPLTYAAVAAMLMAVATAASGVPALRASRLEPTEALRVE